MCVVLMFQPQWFQWFVNTLVFPKHELSKQTNKCLCVCVCACVMDSQGIANKQSDNIICHLCQVTQ